MIDEPKGAGPEHDSSTAPDEVAEVTERVLPALIARLGASRLGELEVRTERWRVRLRRERTGRIAAPSSALGDMSMVSSSDGPAGGGRDAPGMARSPGVGYFTPAAGLSVGDAVRAGDALGAVDVLGVMQDVSAPLDGIVGHVLADPGQAVEYGQGLVDIVPLGGPVPADDTPDQEADAAAVGES